MMFIANNITPFQVSQNNPQSCANKMFPYVNIKRRQKQGQFLICVEAYLNSLWPGDAYLYISEQGQLCFM